ncbi:hypothetical protein ACOSP7_025793 [Xanthoceras sorbifolium]|uniref:Bifunctional inhibitor/plant lipid transfer protein/seed storage helical domain-containing protein n=1 Tax=Xanthoceras sorbifolium TaxID=99658 RepID=A0ABQ8H690_9ROSI|nr:hypothetical protein JRO89_XS13G0030200 [Xanthoceras sorbifolium]
MNSKLFFSCFIIFCSCFFVGYSREIQRVDNIGLNPTGGNVVGGGGGNGSMACVTKLLPCKLYLKSEGPPPATCCMPMKEVVAHDAECLCNALNNPEIMKSFNVTIDEAIVLAEACGANADLSKCKAATPPTSSPNAPSTPTNSSIATNSSTDGSSSNNTIITPPSSDAANGISHFAGLGFFAFFVGLLAV